MPVDCVHYGAWVIDEQAENHVCMWPDIVEKETAGTDENGQAITNRFVNLPVAIPDREIPEGAEDPEFEHDPDWLKLDGVEVQESNSHSVISAKKLAAGGIVRAEQFYVRGVKWEVWRDEKRDAYMMVEHKGDGRRVACVISRNDQQHLLDLEL